MPNRAEKCWLPIVIGALAWVVLAALTLMRGPIAPGSPAALNWQTESKANQALADSGMGWAKVHVRNGVMTVSGAPPRQRGIASVSAIAQASTRAQFGFPGVYYKVVEDFGSPAVSAPALPATPASAAPSPAPPASVAAPSSPTQCNTLFEKAIGAQEIRFATGRSQLPASAHPLLAALTDVARKCSAYKITIGGHTDARGDPAYNQALSEQRAQAVLNYLASHGAERKQLAAIGYGASRPISTESTYAAHRQNRRITFAVSNIP
jgi:outer membrane protein OmpA-like peptidoglycan-associated protein